MEQLKLIEKKLDKLEKKLDNHIEDVWLVYKPIKKTTAALTLQVHTPQTTCTTSSKSLLLHYNPNLNSR